MGNFFKKQILLLKISGRSMAAIWLDFTKPSGGNKTAYQTKINIFILTPYQIWDQIWKHLDVVISPTSMWIVLHNSNYWLRYKVWKFPPI
jgi:hypothetical protein